jgi:hypothetical protein
MKVGINGMGRIGRLALRAAMGAIERPDHDPRAGNRLEVVHLNELKGGAAATAHLLAFDTVQGKWRANIRAEGSDTIRHWRAPPGVQQPRQPADIPWGDLGVDLVLECTGKFLTPETLQGHLDRGAKRVIVAAPVKTVGVCSTSWSGINEHLYNPANRIVTAASLHHQLPGPGGEGGARSHRHQARADHHHPRPDQHQPGGGRAAQGPAPRPQRHGQPGAHDHRQRHGHCADLPRTQGQAQRPRGACPGAQRLADRLRVRAAARHHGRRGERPVRSGRRARWPASWATRPPAGQRRLRARHTQLHRRRRIDPGDRRHAAQGLRLVRQRNGLRLPHGGPGLPHGSPGI